MPFSPGDRVTYPGDDQVFTVLNEEPTVISGLTIIAVESNGQRYSLRADLCTLVAGV